MKINNTSVQGIYKYSENLEFELGDFVIYNSSIYLCTPRTSQTVFPITPDKDNLNFTPYLSTEKISIEELLDLYNNGIDDINNLGDKIVTGDILCQFLKKISFGLDFSGVIDKEVLSNLVSPEFGEFTDISNTDLLDLLATDTRTEYNNLTIKVSRELIKELIQEKPNNVDDSDFNSVILKHYTYFERSEKSSVNDKGIQYRVQEIIDHVFGVCLYRYVKLSATSSNELSTWKVSCPSVEYVNKLSTVLNHATTQGEISNNRKLFNFKEVSFIEPVGVSANGTYSYVINDTLDGVITITISETRNNEHIHRNYSMTVKYANNVKYKFPNNTEIRFTGNSIELKKDTEEKEVKIINIYTRNYE